MNKLRSHLLPLSVNLALFFILYIAHYSGIFSIKIMNANPLTPLALLVAVCMFSKETTAAFTGLTLGIFMDAVSSDSSVIYTVTLFIAALAVALTVHYYFNNNIRSAITLCILACVFVFLVRWFFFHALQSSLDTSLKHLLYYVIPSIIYTSVFVIPFYYLEQLLHRNIQRDNFR